MATFTLSLWQKQGAIISLTCIFVIGMEHFVFIKDFVMQIDDGIHFNSRNECQKTTKWFGSSVGSSLARYARGPRFESRSDHVFSFPVTFGG